MTRSPPTPAIVWFRDDLRLSDQPALAAALASGSPVLCVYILDELSPGLRPLGGAARWWLHHTLEALSVSLTRIGGRLDILRGAGAEAIENLALSSGARHVYWTRRYGAAEIAVDGDAKARLKHAGVEAASFNGQLLFEPWTLKTGAGGFFRVFTPFWRAARNLPPPPEPTAAPQRLIAAPWPRSGPARVLLDDLDLLPKSPDWAGGLRSTWRPGEAGAKEKLAAFIDERLSRYALGRDRPDVEATSLLSPHLRFGEISPRQVLAAARHADAAGKAKAADVDKFLSEIGWREFAYHLLYHSPDLATQNFQPKFDAFPWRSLDPSEWRLWRKGLTGYPIVDAGMRELWTTGYMHNRVRMICASFLIKDMLIDWREGERWFWDTLCDADPANNAASWQWVAGSGADAAPYYRIFNPVLQGEKFDAKGDYVRRHVPELANLDDSFIHKPWLAPPDVLASAGIVLGRDYPKPIVDHATARDRALAALSTLSPRAE